MPEGPVLKAWAHRLQRHILSAEEGIEARLVFYPRCFAVGTAVKGYVTCTTQQEPDYDPAMDLADEDRAEHMRPSAMDLQRSKNKSWEYLLDGRRPGEFSVGVHGKILAIAAGHHLVFVNFGLEANVLPVSSQDYAAFAAPSQDIPGTNKSKQKANKMRSFAVPDQYKEDKSTNADNLRRLNIFLAVVGSDGMVWLFVDHVRLIRFHVVSRGSPWTAQDLEPQSPVWWYAWNGKYGPDWFTHQMSSDHQVVLLNRLYHWRQVLLAQMENEDADADKKTLSATIADAISEDMATFNGFGKHTAMDLLHELCLLPHMFVSDFIQNDEHFDRFQSLIFDYLAKFDQPAFFQKCAGQLNSNNPLSFNEGANSHYISTYVSVYRRACVRITGNTYNAFASAGLFDPLHVIGEKYCKPVKLTTKKFQYCAVYKYTAGSDGSSFNPTYSIIQALPPASWNLDHWIKNEVTEDIRTVGLMTTLGLAQFHQFNSNMIRYDDKQSSKGGRPSIEHTGKRGRPRKSKTTTQLKQLAKRGKTSQLRYLKLPFELDTNVSHLSSPSSPQKITARVTRSRSKRSNENLPPVESDCLKRPRIV